MPGGSPVQYRVLGPVEAWRDGRPLPLSRTKPRTLLAVLLAHANEAVPVDHLVGQLWDARPPRSARNLVQGYASHLRAVLGADALLTSGASYVLPATSEQLDCRRFEQLVAGADALMERGLLEEAVAAFGEALALWRGPAFSATASPGRCETAGRRLEERRLLAVERRVECELQLGRHRQQVGELLPLVDVHPHRTRLRAHLMLALYRSGRTAEALDVYRRVPGVDGERGSEPDPELSWLERQIRGGDLTLLRPRGERRPAVPAQLPPLISDFTAREPELAAIRALLRPMIGTPVIVVSGCAGVGKTTLTLRLGHELAGQYPDGQLYADLQNADLGPVDPADVLASLLRVLGVDGSVIPSDLHERTALYRSRLLHRRVLLVLDNAADESQVRPLLPSGPGCAALVTSRRPLSGLEAARHLTLDVLGPDEAVDLLVAVAGRERVDAEPEAARSIAELCGRLPLAIRVAGARVAARSRWRLEEFVVRLEDERQRLDELKVGDLEVRASLALTYRSLDGGAQRALRLLSLLDSPDFASWLAVAVLDQPAAAVDDLLERMLDAHLLEVASEDPCRPARYRLHSLIRIFARELAARDDGMGTRGQVIERALGAQLALCERALDLLSPGNAREVPRGSALRYPIDDSRVGAMIEHDALAWYESERSTLVVGVGQAARGGLSEVAWELACRLPTFFGLRGYWQDWRSTTEWAIDACRQTGNRRGEAHAVRCLGVCWLWSGELERARSCFQRCHTIAEEISDPSSHRAALLGLGLVAAYQGGFDEATRLLEECLSLFRKARERHGEAVALLGLSDIRRFTGRPAEGMDLLNQCLAIFRLTGDRHWEAIALLTLGDHCRAAGRAAEGEAALRRCLEIFRRFGNRHFEALVLYRLARFCSDRGDQDAAIRLLERCRQAFRELGLEAWEARAGRALARLLAVPARGCRAP